MSAPLPIPACPPHLTHLTDAGAYISKKREVGRVRFTHPLKLPNTPIERLFRKCITGGMSKRQALTVCNGKRIYLLFAISHRRRATQD